MNHLREFQSTGKDLFVGQMNNTHSGNLSVRINKMLAITRSGSMLHNLEYSDIIETLIDGEDSNTAKASREMPVHQSIYQNTDAQAIVHAHPPHIIALSLQNSSRIYPIDAEGMYFFAQGIPVLEVENAIASDEVAQKIIPLLKESPIVAVKGHGTFAIGKDLEEGLHWTSSVEHSAKIVILKNQLL